MAKKQVNRREFLANVLISTLAFSSSPLLAASKVEKRVNSRPSLGNLFLKKGNPLLVEVSGSNAEDMLLAGLDSLGGLQKLLAKGKSVLIKPNFVAPQHYPVISDPDFVFLLAKHCIKAGFEEVVVADISTL